MNWLKRLMAHPPMRQITLVNVQSAELVERTKARHDEARQAVGVPWTGHSDARPTRARLDELHAEAIAEDARRSAPRRVFSMRGRS